MVANDAVPNYTSPPVMPAQTSSRPVLSAPSSSLELLERLSSEFTDMDRTCDLWARISDCYMVCMLFSMIHFFIVRRKAGCPTARLSSPLALP